MEYKDLMHADRKCPFDNPAFGEIMMENKSAYLTYALAPYHKDHLLVVPKRHVNHITDITKEEQDDIDALENHAWQSLQKLGYKSVSYLVREGEGSGRTLSHIHFHVIPDSKIGDLEHDSDSRALLTAEEIKEGVARMKTVL